VTLGDEEARTRGTQKSVLERKGPPTFPIVVEMRDRSAWVAHDTSESVDTLLKSKIPKVQVRHHAIVGGDSKAICNYMSHICITAVTTALDHHIKAPCLPHCVQWRSQHGSVRSSQQPVVRLCR
jgi:hypothetical protein